MFGDPRWRHSVRITLWYVVVGTPIKLIAALGVALLLAQKRRGQAFYRAAFYAPSMSLFHPVLVGEMGWSAGVVTRQGPLSLAW